MSTEQTQTVEEAAAAEATEATESQGPRRERILALKRELVGGDLFTAAEVAEILDIHPRTVGEYIRDGKLRAFQFGGGWKVSESALRQFVRGQTLGVPGEENVAVTALSRAINGLLSLVPGSASGSTTSAPAGETGSTAAKPRLGKRSSYRCSFCGKGQEQVRRLIAGPNGVYICNECVTLCNNIMAEHEREEAGAPEDNDPKP